MKILVVDDVAAERAAARALLAALGHEIVEAANGVEALAAYELVNPDMVLLDVTMPLMDGLETARRIRALPLPWRPIIFVSASTSPEDIAAGIDAGGDDYLIKPLSKVIFTAKLLAMQRIVAMKSIIDRNDAQGLQNDALQVAEVDAGTGFMTACGGSKRLAQEFSRCSRSQQPLSLLLVAVDEHAEIERRHGQAGMARCLKKLSVALKANAARMSDAIARYDASCFSVLLPETPLTGAMKVGDQVRKTIHEVRQRHPAPPDHDFDGEIFIPFTVSIGIATVVASKGEDPQALVDAAEAGLFQSIQGGGDRVTANALQIPLRLTAREIECLQWCAIGKSSWEISGILNISESAINFHMANIRRKFGVNSRRQAVALAIQVGLIRAA